MFNRHDIKSCSTVQDLIEYGDVVPISNEKLHYKKVITMPDGTKTVINFLSVLDKYYDILLDQSVRVVLSDDEYARYKYKPKLLCYEVYNNMDLAPLILRINNMLSVTEFTKKEIRMFKTDITKFINEILVLEETSIDNNKVEIEKEIRR